MIDKYTTETGADAFIPRPCGIVSVFSARYAGSLFLYIFQPVSTLLTGSTAYQRYG